LRSGIDTKIITAQEARDLNDVQGIKWAAEKKDRTDFRRARLRRMGAKHIVSSFVYAI